MSKDYEFETNCIGSTYESITSMTSVAQPVTYQTVLRNCYGLLDWAKSIGYDVHGQDLKLKDDWAVSFHKSVYRGKPCYYVKWSGIEHIWVKRR